MKLKLCKNEAAILEYLSQSSEPLGSWNLVDKLEKKGLYLSSATIGRTLNSLEKAGYLVKNRNHGRTITPKGIEALHSLEINKHIKEHAETIERLMATTTLEDYILVLEARKAIERETVKFAAENITDKEILALEVILEQQRLCHSKNKSVAENDISFHRAIASASRNKILEALYLMLFSYGQQTQIFEYIRKQVNSPYMKWHSKILNALKARDSELAQECMVAHMDSLIDDVRQFWDLFNASTNEK